jgi:pimeloyl-ACP methyl ester carboxylesterase
MKFRFNEEVKIQAGDVLLEGELIVPENADAIILFSHGSGSSRKSPRNKMVAEYLHGQNFGTLLFDLLTGSEDKLYENRFNIELLTQRLLSATEWLKKHLAAKKCKLAYFGASTGAASALKAAAALPGVGAVVSRGGRPDMAMDNLPFVKAPVLLIVGSYDYEVLKLNEAALKKLNCERELEIVQGATHLFEEKGAMEQVCEVAANWFKHHLHPLTLTH